MDAPPVGRDDLARALLAAGAADGGWDALSGERRDAYRRMADHAIALRDEAVARAIVSLESAIES